MAMELPVYLIFTTGSSENSKRRFSARKSKLTTEVQLLILPVCLKPRKVN